MNLLKKLESLEAKAESVEHARRVAEVEAWAEEKRREFNSEKCRREREAWYQKLLRDGEERKKRMMQK